MTGKAERINTQRGHIQRDFTGSLHRIAKQQTAMLPDHIGNFGDRLNDAGFIIGQHEADQCRCRLIEQRGQRRQIDLTIGQHRHGFNRQAGCLRRCRYGAVLNR